ncbi:MFS transporter [Nocardiopsis sp. LOL_012]|uniref:MFS transporter n=1 Tax=Nocardiopsis sp. LOL_012 TaxID=3345409 RepID=UPI003A8A39E2
MSSDAAARASAADAPQAGSGAAAASRRTVLSLMAAGVALAALNLRTAITSVGAVLDEVSRGLGMSAVQAGLLTTLPVLCFALLGGLTPLLSRSLGGHRLMVYALTALAAGLAGRALADGPWPFLALSALALSGGAVGNVLLPTLVKQHFPDRVGLMTTVYTTALAVGTALAAGATVPLEQATGQWRIALGSYALFGVAALLPWLLVLRRGGGAGGQGPGASPLRVLRTGLGRQSVLYFGTQSAVAYIMFGWYVQMLRDQGMDPQTAGLALSYLSLLGVPVSLFLPLLLTRMGDQRPVAAVFTAAYLAGIAGLWFAPLAGVWLWTTFLGVAMGGSFVFALTSFALRTRTGAGTAAMSAASQGLGYLMGGAGPFLFGFLHESSGGWHAPLLLMLVLAAANAVAGQALGRPRHLEDALERVSPAASRRGR